jgi:Tol biopolymer transport system component
MNSKTTRCIEFLVILLLMSSRGFSAPAPANVSSSGAIGVSGAGGSYAASFGGSDGRYVVFLSHANNLATNDGKAAFLDVFLHDRATAKTILITPNAGGAGGGDGDSSQASVSPDGRRVVFASLASNLLVGGADTNNAQDIFFHDLDTGLTTPAGGSIGLAPRLLSENLQPGNPIVIHGGSLGDLVFETTATNLTTLPDTNRATDIFIIMNGADPLVSINAAGTASGNAGSERPSASSDGWRIAFLSRATDLVNGVTNIQGDIYVRDLANRTTTWVSATVAQHLPNYRCHPPTISTNGQVVVFKASEPSAASGIIFHVELNTGSTTVIHTNSPTSTEISLSGDGQTLAFDDGAGVWVWEGGSTRLVTTRHGSDDPADGVSASPILSLDGHIVAYVSTATNLVPSEIPTSATAWQIYVKNLQTGETRLVTQNTNGIATDSSHQFSHIVLSPDGSQLAFDSRAGDLVAADLNGESDVFVTAVESNSLALISRRDTSIPSLTAARNVRIAPGCLTTDKRYLLFAALDRTTSQSDASYRENLFIRDLTTGEEEQITEFNNERVIEHVISADGQAVVYIAQSNGIPANSYVVHLDRTTGTRTLVHTNSQLGGFLTGPFRYLAISSDGGKIAYHESISNSSLARLYLFDLNSGSNRLVNVRFDSPLNVITDGKVSAPRISPDGSFLVFGGESSQLTRERQRGIFCLNLTNQTALQCIPSFYLTFGAGSYPAFSADSRFIGFGPTVADLVTLSTLPIPGVAPQTSPRGFSLSANGRYVAFEYPADNLFVSDRKWNTVEAVGLNINGAVAADGRTHSPLIAPDGRYVIFTSQATELVAGKTNRRPDIYLRDLTRDSTILLSSGDGGLSAGNGSSSLPILSADGRTVLFQSYADDLVAGDYNYSRDIFIAQISGPDTDGDQMDDDWEMGFFRTLFRNGLRDLDGDGATDLAEFRAGTDPTDQESIFRVFTITSLNAGQTRLVWSAFPGRSYRAQYKDGIGDSAWIDLPKVITPIGTTASTTDESPGPHPQRFYRVMLLP